MHLYMLLVLIYFGTSYKALMLLYLRLFITYFKFLDGMQNFIPNMWQIVLQIYLFRVGLLTLLYISSFMAIAILCLYLPMILKLSTVCKWPVVLLCSKIGKGAFKYSLNLSAKPPGTPPLRVFNSYQTGMVGPEDH